MKGPIESFLSTIGSFENHLYTILKRRPLTSLFSFPDDEISQKLCTAWLLPWILPQDKQMFIYDEIPKAFSEKVSKTRIQQFSEWIKEHEKTPQIYLSSLFSTAIIAWSYFRINGFTISPYEPLLNLISRSRKVQAIALPIFERLFSFPLPLSSISPRMVILTPLILQLVKIGICKASLSDETRKKLIQIFDKIDQMIGLTLHACLAISCLAQAPSIPIALLSTLINYDYVREFLLKLSIVELPSDFLTRCVAHLLVFPWIAHRFYPSDSWFDFGFSTAISALWDHWTTTNKVSYIKLLEQTFHEITILDSRTPSDYFQSLELLLEKLESSDEACINWLWSLFENQAPFYYKVLSFIFFAKTLINKISFNEDHVLLLQEKLKPVVEKNARQLWDISSKDEKNSKNLLVNLENLLSKAHELDVDKNHFLFLPFYAGAAENLKIMLNNPELKLEDDKKAKFTILLKKLQPN